MRRSSSTKVTEPIYAVYDEVANVGKTVAASKKRATWKFAIGNGGSECIIQLVHSSFSAKKVVTFDGQVVIETQTVGDFTHTWPQGGHMYRVDITDDEFRPFTLTIDGTDFRHLPKPPAQSVASESLPKRRRDHDTSSTVSSNSNEGAATKSISPATTHDTATSFEPRPLKSTGFSLDVFSDVPPISNSKPTSFPIDIFAPTSPTAFSSISSSSKATNDIMRQFDLGSTPIATSNLNFNTNSNNNSNAIFNAMLSPRQVTNTPSDAKPTNKPVVSSSSVMSPPPVNNSNNNDPWAIVKTSSMFPTRDSTTNNAKSIQVKKQSSLDELDVFAGLGK